MKKRCISLAVCAALMLSLGTTAYAADSKTTASTVVKTALEDGVLQFSELENCVRSGNPNVQACTESMAKLNTVDRKAVIDALKKTDNLLTNAIWNYSKTGDTTALKNQQAEVEKQIDNYSEENYAETYNGSVLQINSGINQVLKATQTLYFGIVKLDYGMQTVQRSLDALSRAIELTEVRCSVGHASEDTLRQLQDQYADVKSQLTALQAQSKTYKISLQSMISAPKTDGSLQVRPPEMVADANIQSIDLNRDIEEGKAANTIIYQDQQTMDDAKDDWDDMQTSPFKQHTYQQAIYTLAAAKDNFRVHATSLYQTLLENQRLYKVTLTDLSAAQKTYALAQTKYAVGSMSSFDLLNAKDALSTAQQNVELATLNLSSAYACYSWVKLGITS